MENRIITQKDLIDTIAESTDKSKKNVKEVFDALEQVLFTELGTPTEEQPVEIKIVSGIHLISEFVPEYIGRNPANGEPITVPSKNKIKAKIGRQAKNAINHRN